LVVVALDASRRHERCPASDRRATPEALRNARPPVFFQHQESMRRQLGSWSEARLRVQLDRLARAELNMKQTFPAETLCRQALSALVWRRAAPPAEALRPSRSRLTATFQRA
jgi:hypothetical protein